MKYLLIALLLTLVGCKDERHDKCKEKGGAVVEVADSLTSELVCVKVIPE